MAERERTPKERLLWNVRISRRYHRRRRAFFQGLHRLSSGIVIFSGMGVVASVVKQSDVATVIAGIIAAAASTIDLVVPTGESAQLHLDLERRFISLEKAIVTTDEDGIFNEGQFTQERLTIEADEPPILRTLVALCHNELCRAEGRPKKYFVSLRWFHHLSRHIVDIRPDLLVPFTEREENEEHNRTSIS